MRKAHPVEFEAVEIIAGTILFDQPEGILADLGVAEIEGAVGGAGKAPRMTPEFGVGPPKAGVHGSGLVIDVVQVVHAHRNPGSESVAARAGDPERVGVDAALGQVPGGVDPLTCASAGFLGSRLQERLIVRALGVVAFPDRVPAWLSKLVRMEFALRIISRIWVPRYWSMKDATDSAFNFCPARVEKKWLWSSLKHSAVVARLWARAATGNSSNWRARGHLANQFSGKNGLAQMALRMFREVDDQAADAGG